MATATKIPNRFAAIIAELDEVSEICESKGDTEACSYIDQVAAQLLASNEESASRPARRRESPRTAELRALARQVKKAGSPAAARALLRVADEMDFDLDLDPDAPADPSALDDAGQEPASESPAPEMLPCQCECHTAPADAPAEPAIDLAPAPAPDAGLAPTDEQVEASIKVLQARAAALKAKAKPQTKKASEVVADESVEGALAALDAELAREADAEAAPAAATTTSDEQALFAEIEGLEQELQARAKAVKPAKPAKGADVRRTAQEVARTLEAGGQPRAARRIRNLLG